MSWIKIALNAGIFQLGWILGGVLDELIGTRGTTLIGAGGSMAVVALTFLFSRDLRRLS